MQHRRTPPVLRRTKPELLAGEERSRRGRRLRIGSGLVGGGLLIATVSALVVWTEGGVAVSTGVAMAFGLAAAIGGLWSLRSAA